MVSDATSPSLPLHDASRFSVGGVTAYSGLFCMRCVCQYVRAYTGSSVRPGRISMYIAAAFVFISRVCVDCDVCFYRSPDLQHRGLSVIADRSSDTLEHCQLVLLLLNKFPNMVNGHGVSTRRQQRSAVRLSHIRLSRAVLICLLGT